MIKSMVDPVGSTSASKESAIVAFGKAQRATLSALQPFFLVPKFDEREEGTGDAHRPTSAFASEADGLAEADGGLTQRRRFLCRISFVARALCQWFPVCVTPCAARSSVQVTWTRGRGHPTVPRARWRSPLALTSDHPPPIHPFVFEAVAPRKLVSQLREITFSGPLASFVGKNFDTRQDACWGQLRDEAVCSRTHTHIVTFNF